ncbi:hypothetical protein TNCV_4739671 [Trichonephila clavipes]|nr:hypothetical protein TNCV_4739671 [Trichonephila clavipes]
MTELWTKRKANDIRHCVRSKRSRYPVFCSISKIRLQIGLFYNPVSWLSDESVRKLNTDFPGLGNAVMKQCVEQSLSDLGKNHHAGFVGVCIKLIGIFTESNSFRFESGFCDS